MAVTGSEKHIKLSLEAANEGMVLLKNEEGLLPLAKGTKVAIFGTAQFDYVRGGGGSGDVTTAYTRNIYEGFKMMEKDGRVEVFEPLSQFFKENVEKQQKKKVGNGRTVQPKVTKKMMGDAAKFADVAILTICRFSWEGADRKGEAHDGDFYLSVEEEALKDAILEKFDKVIVVLDVGGMVDSCWFKKEAKIQSVLMAWQAGIEGGQAIAQTICGISNPSGRLVDTFADSFGAYPSSAHFNDSISYVDYTEDIYVGYRYFETFTAKKKHVNYPFGFGLSYTTFETEVKEVILPESHKAGDGAEISVKVCIKNTGKLAGKEVTAIYYEAPNGKLFKPARQLAAFAKSSLLKPGKSEEITMTFKVSQMASFDDLGKVKKSCYVLEKGEYKFYVGANVQTAAPVEKIYTLKSNVIEEKLSSLVTPHKLKKRLLGDGSYEKLPTDKTPVSGQTCKIKEWECPTGATLSKDMKLVAANKLKDVEDGKITMKDFVKKLPVEVLIEMLGGQPNVGVSNTFGMGNCPAYGIPNVTTADGPAGLRITPDKEVYTTAWPIATMLACTWNTELVRKVGEAGAKEVKENKIGVWLTPAMNIHRSPLCGRNFEYYSEDPFMAGKMGAAMILGIQSQKIACSMKHFACNNKEVDRRICDSRVSERALREIYLKGFEIAVKEADPWTIMTCYNPLNGKYPSQNKELLEGILRKEWGFKGMITTDWWNSVDHPSEVKAGNDLKMAIGEPLRVKEAYDKGEVTRKEIEACVTRMLNTILKLDKKVR